MTAYIRRAGLYIWHTVVCMTLLVLVLGVFWSVSYVLSIRHRRQAERMLQRLADLPPGPTDFRSVQQLIRESGGKEYCNDQLCRYDFDDSFMFADSRLPRVLTRTEWDHFGLRPWTVSVVILKRPSGLTDVEVIAGVGRGRGWLENEGLFSGNMWGSWIVIVRTNAEEFDHAFEREKKDILSYGSKTGDQIEAMVNGLVTETPRPGEKRAGGLLNVYLSPKASPEIRRAAFDLNLRCATDISPCTQLCQLAPSAWHTYVRFLESNGLGIGQLPECEAIAHHR